MTAWTRVSASAAVQIEEHDLLRWNNAPVCAVKRRDTHWECSCLCLTGISASLLTLPIGNTIAQVRAACELHLVAMGWTNPHQRENVDG